MNPAFNREAIERRRKVAAELSAEAERLLWAADEAREQVNLIEQILEQSQGNQWAVAEMERALSYWSARRREMGAAWEIAIEKASAANRRVLHPATAA